MGEKIAQITNPPIGGLTDQFQGQGGTTFVGALLQTAVTILLVVGGLYFFFQLLTGAVAWIGSGGDKAKLEESRQKLLNAGLGLVLLFSAFAIITLIENVFGVGLLNFNVPVIGQSSGGGGSGGATISCQGTNQCSGCPSNTFCTCYSNGTCVF